MRVPPLQACRAQRADLARLLADTGGGGGVPTLVRLELWNPRSPAVYRAPFQSSFATRM